MRKKYILLFPLLLTAAGSIQAGPTFVVTMNTSSISGDQGSLDFSLSPGAGSNQSLSVTISNFNGGSYDGTVAHDGNASGGPVTAYQPLTLTANSVSQLNDEFDTFTYGNFFSFDITVNGPALTAPNGSATAPYEFDLFTYSNPVGSMPILTTDPNAISAKIDVSADGILTTANVSSFATVTAAPEPGSIGLFASAGAFAAFVILFRRLRTNAR